GIMRTPVKTIMLMTMRVTIEIAALRTRKSNTGVAATRSVPGCPLDPDQAVGDGLVALEVLRERDDVVRMIDVDDVAPGREEVDPLAVEPPSLIGVADLARSVEDRVDLLVAGARRVQAALARLDLVDVAVGIHPPPPADLECRELAGVAVV